MVMKDERLNPARKNLRLAWARQPQGPYGPPSPPFSPSWVEGPSALKVGRDWLLYFDHYAKPQYYRRVAVAGSEDVGGHQRRDPIPEGHPPRHRLGRPGGGRSPASTLTIDPRPGTSDPDPGTPGTRVGDFDGESSYLPRCSYDYGQDLPAWREPSRSAAEGLPFRGRGGLIEKQGDTVVLKPLAATKLRSFSEIARHLAERFRRRRSSGPTAPSPQPWPAHSRNLRRKPGEAVLSSGFQRLHPGAAQPYRPRKATRPGADGHPRDRRSGALDPE